MSDTSEVFIVISFSILMLASILFIHPKWMAYENGLRQTKIEKQKRNDLIAFRFLLKSGKSRLKRENYKGAYSEFKLAKAIYPENIQVNVLLE